MLFENHPALEKQLFKKKFGKNNVALCNIVLVLVRASRTNTKNVAQRNVVIQMLLSNAFTLESNI